MLVTKIEQILRIVNISSLYSMICRETPQKTLENGLTVDAFSHKNLH